VHRDPKELFGVLASELRSAVNFDFTALFLYDGASSEAQNAVLETVEGRGIVIPSDVPPEQTITWWVFHHQEPVLITSAGDETRFARMMEIYRQHDVQWSCELALTTAYRGLGSQGCRAQRANAYSRQGRGLRLIRELSITPHNSVEFLTPVINLQP
jgi:formate hydrogenlyase transcriptional activator